MWNIEEWRPATAEELRVSACDLERVWELIPRRWVQLLQVRWDPLPGDWVMVLPDEVVGQVKVRIGTDDVMVEIRTQRPAGGWASATLQVVPRPNLRLAVVEEECSATDRSGPVVWLTGLAHTHFAASRVRMRCQRTATELSKLTLRHAYLMLTTRRDPKVQAAVRILRAINPAQVRPFRVQVMLHKYKAAAWPAAVKNFAWSMIGGFMPCGRAVVGAIDSRCPHCGGERDAVDHFVQHCASVEPLREWMRVVTQMLGWAQPVDFGSLVLYGHVKEGQPQVQVVQCALVDGLRATRHARVRQVDQRTLGAAEMWRIAETRLQRGIQI